MTKELSIILPVYTPDRNCDLIIKKVKGNKIIILGFSTRKKEIYYNLLLNIFGKVKLKNW